MKYATGRDVIPLLQALGIPTDRTTKAVITVTVDGVDVVVHRMGDWDWDARDYERFVESYQLCSKPLIAECTDFESTAREYEVVG